MDNPALAQKIEYLSQMYFELDEPVPFKNGLKIYPVKVKDYYKFYSVVQVFTIDKNEDIRGIPLSYLDYLFLLMKEEGNGRNYTSQLILILQMVFKIKNGLYCSNSSCENYKKIIPYGEIWDEADKIKDEKEKKLFFDKMLICPHCGRKRQEVFGMQINRKTKKGSLKILDTVLNARDFDELKEIVCHQNIPDYGSQGEFYDKELEEELKIKAQMENPNNVQPTLEKQLCCIVSSSAYTYDQLKEVTIRRMVLLLRTIDAKLHYFCYRQAEASGMVTFKNDIQHWIYSNDKHDLSKDVMTLDALKDKLKQVT